VLYCLANARHPEQVDEMRRLDAAGACVLCDIRTGLFTTHWVVAPNRYPYPDAVTHLLLVPRRHLTDLRDLSTAERSDFWCGLDLARGFYGIDDFQLRVRCGDMQRTGATIAHLHVHLIVRGATGA